MSAWTSEETKTVEWELKMDYTLLERVILGYTE